jgi:hypothetical protein
MGHANLHPPCRLYTSAACRSEPDLVGRALLPLDGIGPRRSRDRCSIAELHVVNDVPRATTFDDLAEALRALVQLLDRGAELLAGRGASCWIAPLACSALDAIARHGAGLRWRARTLNAVPSRNRPSNLVTPEPRRRSACVREASERPAVDDRATVAALSGSRPAATRRGRFCSTAQPTQSTR